MNEEENKMLTTREVAELLRISPRTVTRLANKNKMPGAIRIGRQWRFDRILLTLPQKEDQT